VKREHTCPASRSGRRPAWAEHIRRIRSFFPVRIQRAVRFAAYLSGRISSPSMSTPLLHALSSAQIGLLIFVLYVVAYYAGNRLKRFRSKNTETAKEGASISTGIMGLLGLLLGFSFSMANSRYDARRDAIIEEANAIGTAFLRTAVYPDSMMILLRAKMKDYVEARIAYVEAGADIPKALAAYDRGKDIGNEIWYIAANFARTQSVVTRDAQMLPALNAMLDSASARLANTKAQIPTFILQFLVLLSVATAFFIGYEQKSRFDWIQVVVFSFIFALTVKTVIDLDQPRRGAITLKEANQQILDLRDLFK
jgi:hypothetical protein